MFKVLGKKIKRMKAQLEPKPLFLSEFSAKRNKILISREVGGLGDILMHRMMFEDFKLLMPDSHIVFACPKQYLTAVEDHPYIDEVVDFKTIDANDFIISYNTTFICGRYEMKIAPFADKNRSDIWANHCGVDLQKHNMHITLSNEEKFYGNKAVDMFREGKKPVVCISPVSAMLNKNLTFQQLSFIIEYLQQIGCTCFCLHTSPIPEVKISTLCGLNVRQWMGVINSVDYVVSVDTSAFHCAGGLRKPLVGIFTFACGKTYGRHYPTMTLVQKHRDNGNWDCGPCYNWSLCPKTQGHPKPCLLEINTDMLKIGIDTMFRKFPWKYEMKIPRTLDILS